VVFNKVTEQFLVVWQDMTDREFTYFWAPSICGNTTPGFEYFPGGVSDDLMVRYRPVGYSGGTPVRGASKNISEYIVTDTGEVSSDCVTATLANTPEDAAGNAGLEFYDIKKMSFDIIVDESSPDIAYGPSDGIAVTAWSGKHVTVDLDLYWWREVVINSTGYMSEGSWHVDGEWTEPVEDGNQKIIVRKNTGLGRAKHIDLDANGLFSYNPSLAIMENNQTKMLLAAWESEDPNTDMDIYGQIIDASNHTAVKTTFPISNAQYRQTAPRVAVDPANQRFLVAWEDARNEEANISNMDIYGQFIDPQGQLSGGNFPITVDQSNQINPVVAFGDNDARNFLVAWSDGRNASVVNGTRADADIYANFWEDSTAPQLWITDADEVPLYNKTIDFGEVLVGEPMTRLFKICNYGNAPLTISQFNGSTYVAISPLDPSKPFNMTTAKPTSINPATCYLMAVTFTPDSPKSYSGLDSSMEIISNGGKEVIYLSGYGKGNDPVITTYELPDGAEESPYNATLEGTGGTTPYTWAIVNASGDPEPGLLPDGIFLSTSASKGLLSGAPLANTTGTYTFDVQLTDANAKESSREFTIKISELSITTASLPDGPIDVPYEEFLQAAGGSNVYTWSDFGGLPDNLSLDPTGRIHGNPSATGTFPFTVQVQDSDGLIATKDLSITITSALSIVTDPATNSDALPSGQLGEAYSFTLSISGGEPPYDWEVLSDIGGLPGGLNIDTVSGVISGTPGSVGTYYFKVQLTDDTGASTVRILSLNVSVITITTESIPDGATDVFYSQQFEAAGGTPDVLYPYSWKLDINYDQLPLGLNLDANSGKIEGTPTENGTKVFLVKATDSLGQTGTKVFAITISDIVVATTSLPGGNATAPYYEVLEVSGGTPNYAWSAVDSDDLPPGLSITTPNPGMVNGGAISGTPTTSGTYTFDVRVSDGSVPSEIATKQFTVHIATDVAITTATLPGGNVDSDYSYTLTATGGVRPYYWSQVSGNMPPGLSIATGTGVLSGTCSAPGTYDIVVQVRDENGSTTQETLSLTVASNPAPADPTDTSIGSSSNTFCYIATAAYGSYLDPHVEALRDFRDEYLLTNRAGRAFVDFYYRTSPPIAGFISGHEALRTAARVALTPLVFSVKCPLLGFALIAMAGGGLAGAFRRGRARRHKG
jgi:hypothetical protein